MGTITKGLAQRQDLDSYDGTLTTTRTDATGGTLTGLKVGDHVDVLSVFGGGLTANQTRATIATATAGLGSSNIALVFAPGTWVIDDDLTIASNFTVVVPAGCIFAPASGKTLTIAGILDRHHDTYTGGAGTVTVTGTDLMAASENTRDYALDTGAANTYAVALTPALTSYTAGRMVRFKAANTNTGASTLNVDSVGAKAIVQADGSTALSAGDITAGQIITVNYEGVDDEFHMAPTAQSVSDPAQLSTANVFTKTQTWKLGADVASATALLVNIDGNAFDITGTTTITSFATKGTGTSIILQFDGILTLTHHSTNLILPAGVNILTAAGDIGVFHEYTTGGWRLVSYTRAKGLNSWNQIGAVQAAVTIDKITFSSGIDSTYRRYVVLMENIRPATDGAVLRAQISQAASFKSDSAYISHTNAGVSNSALYNGLIDNASTGWSLTSAVSSDSNHGFSGELWLPNPASTAMLQQAWWNGTNQFTGGEAVMSSGGGHYVTSAAATDGIQFLFSSGNITSGTFTLYGVS